MTRQDRPIEVGWIRLHLHSGMVLHRAPDLAVVVTHDLIGKEWVLVGTAFQAEPSLPDPQTQIPLTATSAIPEITYTWAGRWALISSELIVPDASGLLGIHYGRDRHGSLVVSSSVALIHKHFDFPFGDRRILSWYGFNWYPPPGTRLAGMSKLLPDQMLQLKDAAVIPICRTYPQRWSAYSLQQKSILLRDKLAHILLAMERAGRSPILMTLTGGLDSRTNLVAAQFAGVTVETITLDHPRISPADVQLPPKISRALGIKHHFVKTCFLSMARRREYDDHTLRCIVDADRYFYSHGSFRNLGAGWLLRSGCWELGRNHFYSRFAGIGLDDVEQRPLDLYRSARCYFQTEVSGKNLTRWATWRKFNPQPANWADLFYRDQRLCGWLSAIEQSLDLIAPTSIHPANSSVIFDLLLSCDDTERTEGSLQRQMIQESAPELAQFPVNPGSDSTFRRAWRRLGNWSVTGQGELRNALGALWSRKQMQSINDR